MTADEIIGRVQNSLNDMFKAFEKVNSTFERLCSAERDVFTATTLYQAATDTVLVEFRDNAKALGSNEDMRKAEIKARCADEYKAMQDATETLAAARRDDTSARFEYDYHKRRLDARRSIATVVAANIAAGGKS